MDGLVIRVGRQLVLFILVMQICNVIIANSNCLIVLATKKNACLGQVYKSDDIWLLLYKLVLSELIVWNQVIKLDLKITDLLAFAS